MSDQIKKVKVFLSQNEFGEAIVGQSIDGLYMPFVCAGDRSVELMRPLAQKIAEATGKVIKLVEFSVREELQIIKPKG